MSSEVAEKLSKQTQAIVSKFNERTEAFKGRSDLFGLTREVNVGDAEGYARERFGQGEHLAFGVDGSREWDVKLQMLLFYANATAYSCPFTVGERLTFDLDRVERSERLSASAAIPLWVEDLSEVDPETIEIELDIRQSVDRIPNGFMTLAELYLASKLASDAKVIFLDRPLSGTHSTLARDVRLLLRGRRLERFGYGERRLSRLDIRLALLMGAPSGRLPPTPRCLYLRVIRELFGGESTVGELSRRLGVGETEVRRALKHLSKLDAEHGETLLESAQGSSVTLREEVSGYWERCVHAALSYAEATLEKGVHPFSRPDEWLTILDVSVISFILLHHLCDLATRNGVLLIGVAKDTTASDISRAVLPYAEQESIVSLSRPRPRLNSDRYFLTLLSAFNPTLATPWRTIGYDAAFSTMFSVEDGEKVQFVPARRKVSRENLFVRGFFQLRTLGSENRVRSPVFLFDRLFTEEDVRDTKKLDVVWKTVGTAVEPYVERSFSRMSNLAVMVLSQCDNPEVFEAMGHNELLFLADKAVKAEVGLMKSSLRGIANLSLGAMARREEVAGISTSFREQRLEAEQSRARSSGSESS